MLGPPVLPHLLVSWMCPHTYTRARHYLSWGPSLAVILCGKSQHRSQQVSWLLSVWKANRILWGSEGCRPGRGSAGFNLLAVPLGKCSTVPGAKQSRQMVRALHSGFGNLQLRVLQPRGCDTWLYSAG